MFPVVLKPLPLNTEYFFYGMTGIFIIGETSSDMLVINCWFGYSVNSQMHEADTKYFEKLRLLSTAPAATIIPEMLNPFERNLSSEPGFGEPLSTILT